MVNEICKGCWLWKKYGKECFVYWENKKSCTMREYSPDHPAPIYPENGRI